MASLWRIANDARLVPLLAALGALPFAHDPVEPVEREGRDVLRAGVLATGEAPKASSIR
jgi:hypothetical protein